MKIIIIWRVTKNRDNKRLRSKFNMWYAVLEKWILEKFLGSFLRWRKLQRLKFYHQMKKVEVDVGNILELFFSVKWSLENYLQISFDNVRVEKL